MRMIIFVSIRENNHSQIYLHDYFVYERVHETMEQKLHEERNYFLLIFHHLLPQHNSHTLKKKVNSLVYFP